MLHLLFVLFSERNAEAGGRAGAQGLALRLATA
jgi:hypothetical protein